MSKIERSPRVRLLLTDEIYFSTSDGAHYSISNISETGIGLVGDHLPTIKKVSGNLFLGDEPIPLSIEFVHVSDGILGARFVDVSSARKVMRSLFQDEVYAMEMSEVDSKKLNLQEEGIPRWFFSQDNYELFFLLNNQEVIRFELSLNGKIYSSSKDSELKFGVVPEENREKPSHARASLVEWQSEVSKSDRKKVLRILQNISGLSKLEQNQLMELAKK